MTSATKMLLMMRRLLPNVLGAFALFLLLASCSPTPQAGGGIGGSGHITSVVSGPITGFGSVFVSGDEYDTSRTLMTVDGKSGAQNDLLKGMIVRLNATVTEHYDTDKVFNRAADALVYEDTVEGVVQSVSPDGTALIVLGQTMQIDSTTIVDTSVPGGNVLNLVPGKDVLEVSGFVIGDGRIKGTLVTVKPVDLKSQTPDYQVKGFIKNHRMDQKTFEIGALSIDYSNAVLNDMPEEEADDPWNGLLVDVKGSKVSSGGPGVQMIATRVRSEGLGAKESEAAEVEGIVTQVLGAGDFFLGSVHVQTNVSTIFQGGTVNDIVIGAHLDVKGPLISGIVTATNVEIER